MDLLIHIERRRINMARHDTSLSNLYRPQDFDEVCGQNSIVKILQRQIALQEFKHVYLFTGPSGTGKTTTARILASKINGSLA